MHQDEDLKSLNKLIADCGGASDANRRSTGPCFLLLEHLHAARRFRLSSTAGEYSLSLRQAKESIDCIVDKGVRAEVKKVLLSLIGGEATRPQTA